MSTGSFKSTKNIRHDSWQNRMAKTKHMAVCQNETGTSLGMGKPPYCNWPMPKSFGSGFDSVRLR